MEVVKDYLDCINFHWLVVVTTGMYMHLRQICIIGLCFDEETNPPFDPSYASLIFMFSLLCLLAEYRLWPSSLKEPPTQLLYIYDMLVSALATNLGSRAIWIPIMNGVWCLTQESSRWIMWLNMTLGLDNYSILMSFASYMATNDAAVHTAFCLSMTKLFCTFWALILNTLGISVFRTCFADATEDEEGEALMTGPPITSFLFAISVYTIILNSSLFPANFRKPKPYILCAYEFLATAFFLEFSVACIWTPIDVLILTTLPKLLCNFLVFMNRREAAKMLTDSDLATPMSIVSCILTFGLFVLSLHVTRALDFTLLLDCGWNYFYEYTKDRLWRRVRRELPKARRNARNSCCIERVRGSKRQRSSS